MKKLTKLDVKVFLTLSGMGINVIAMKDLK